ncbi:large subunit ribosomal protein L29 [Fusibacter tunisiensis]|uniref:Large ribosomal subunit protein uL29 n=2 Tax=Fusibacter tunisiensis TaxID=1008308 RepID=A0ABS2MQW5_9FIRM|nr:50S ribosomal protein L29 [Fusibacter tunisiensis]MBM7561803.1 large subunit ribosomal protein L29 [Fusibacter tunisiensis]
MKATKIREMTTQELNDKVVELKNELFNLRFQLATGQLENPMQIKAIKKDIARVKTILRDKEINA